MVILVAAVVVVHLGSMYFYAASTFDAANRAHAKLIAERIGEAQSAISSSSAASRDAVAHKISSASLTLHWSELPLVDDVGSQDASLRTLRSQLTSIMSGVDERGLRLEYRDHLPPSEAHAILGALALPDGSYLNFSVPLLVGAEPAFHGALLSTSIMAIGVAVVALLLLRMLTKPLRTLASAADAIGHGPDIKVDEDGSEEVRHLAKAFNAMQARINALIADRTQALAAVSHDLRTPITRLRLRAGFVDASGQAAIDADLDEMEAMIDATLAYLRGDIETEERRVIDLSALLLTLVDAASDRGLCATFAGPRQVFFMTRPIALKRAFANLIDNALTYGGAARVGLKTAESIIEVTVDDDGPGIPEEELQRVFEPFRRLEASRSRRTGGVGLGLTTARQVVLHEAGTI
ncbi:MAG TPA: ATP-binding protein, partial [Lacipirellulaceae bacterium]|nr:ATP-binding protein [Lacipirellulaceae bacterium]